MRPKRGRCGATLAEFLSDPRVIEIPAIAWKPILHGIILRTRPRRSAEAYNQIWTNEGSPLRVIAHRQAETLRARLPHISVHNAMRYGHPGIAAALEHMTGEGCTRILAAPLYPQYCAATTATANDAVFAALAKMRVQPALRTLPPYYDDRSTSRRCARISRASWRRSISSPSGCC